MAPTDVHVGGVLQNVPKDEHKTQSCEGHGGRVTGEVLRLRGVEQRARTSRKKPRPYPQASGPNEP